MCWAAASFARGDSCSAGHQGKGRCVLGAGAARSPHAEPFWDGSQQTALQPAPGGLLRGVIPRWSHFTLRCVRSCAMCTRMHTHAHAHTRMRLWCVRICRGPMSVQAFPMHCSMTHTPCNTPDSQPHLSCWGSRLCAIHPVNLTPPHAWAWLLLSTSTTFLPSARAWLQSGSLRKHLEL